jgi:hypothetical protein
MLATRRSLAVQRCVPMLSNDDAASDAHSKFKAVLIKAETVMEAFSRTTKTTVEAMRALILRAEAIMPQLEQRQADELRNEVRSCINNELIPQLNDGMVDAIRVVAMLEIPLGYLCEELPSWLKFSIRNDTSLTGMLRKR